MLTMTRLLLLSAAFLIGGAAAQGSSWPIVNGRQLQPTQQQIDSKLGDKAHQWNRDVQPEIDRIFDELTRDPAPPPR